MKINKNKPESIVGHLDMSQNKARKKNLNMMIKEESFHQ